MKCFCILASAASLLIAIPAIATLATALPAMASHEPYTSSAPSYPIEEIRNLDSTPILAMSDETRKVYRSNGFLSGSTPDGNLYVERIFSIVNREQGQVVVMGSWNQIDCGRMLRRALSGSVDANGFKTYTGITDWSQFSSTSIFADTCEAAASDRGIDWTWERAN